MNDNRWHWHIVAIENWKYSLLSELESDILCQWDRPKSKSKSGHWEITQGIWNWSDINPENNQHQRDVRFSRSTLANDNERTRGKIIREMMSRVCTPARQPIIAIVMRPLRFTIWGSYWQEMRHDLFEEWWLILG